MPLFCFPIILAEASPQAEASGLSEINFTLVLSIFTAMFVGINLMNSYIFKPISEEIEKARVKNEKDILMSKISELNSDGQNKVNDLIKELSNMPRTALICISIYDFLSFAIWFSVVGYFLFNGNISRCFFQYVFCSFGGLTIIAVIYLVVLFFIANKKCDDISTTIKIGVGTSPSKRREKGKRKSI